MRDNLLLNIAPISLHGESTVTVGVTPYTDDALQQLRSANDGSHVFRRDHDRDAIIDIPVCEGVAPVGPETDEIDLTESPWVAASLVRAALARTFQGLGREIEMYQPLRVLGDKGINYLKGPGVPEWLQRRLALTFDTRVIPSKAGDLRAVLVCDARVRNIIDANCAELYRAGLSLAGRYVQIEQEAPPGIRPRLKLVGRVSRQKGDELLLTDCLDGFEKVRSVDSYLEPRHENVEWCLKELLPSQARDILGNADREALRLSSGPGRKEQIEKTLRYLRSKVNLHIAPGVRATIDSLMTSRHEFPSMEVIQSPVMVFDPTGSRTDTWNERGLQQHGPYDQRTYTPKVLNVALVCQSNFEGQVDSFVAKLFDGLPEVAFGNRKPYPDGFVRRFHLDKPNIQVFTTNGPLPVHYKEACANALEQSHNKGFYWDLLVVQTEERFKDLNGNSNPYFTTKSIALKRGIPVQNVRIETMRMPDTSLVYVLNNISLAMYAKVNGVPWLMSAEPTVAHELVVGLGSYNVEESRIGHRQRYVGITTVFSSDGRYLLSNKTTAVPYDHYAGELFSVLKKSIVQIREQDNWRSTDKVRLVFHVFKPLRDIEAAAVRATVDALELNDVTFAFLHVADRNPFLVFDLNQSGIGYGEKKKGEFGPTRGVHIQLGEMESLVVFTGARDLKQADDGMPRPVLLRLHRLSTFKDMTYLARQAFNFAATSWRMLTPEPYPITIRYSELIAQQLVGLKGVSSWDPEAIEFGHIGRTPWFL